MDEIPVRAERAFVAPQGREEVGFHTRHRLSLEMAWGDIPRKQWPVKTR